MTDIERSTQLWERYPDAMDEALARHDELLEDAISSSSGELFKHTGDGLIAVFPSPRLAMAAAASGQRALADEDWSEINQIRVRMAVHTGPAQHRGNDYFGPALNQGARLLDAGHGGQTLISSVANDSLVDGTFRLVDLGEHRLKDLSEPIGILQLESESEFPPLRTLSLAPHNLPVQLASFVGRRRILAEVRQQIPDTRLLTLTGVGGVGKTRLALQAAAELIDEFPDGVWLVGLAALTDGSLLEREAAKALGVEEDPGTPLSESILAHLSDRQLLLILDNCEHVVDSAAKFTELVLNHSPDVHVLVTTREGLGISGEVLRLVPSLRLPGEGDLSSMADLAFDTDEEAGALRLFLERAQEVTPGFALDESNLGTVAQICRRLDGIPLAIELAAARTRVLTPEEILLRLDDRFRLLTGGSRTALPRQQTLEATMDWSHDLLSEREQVVLRRLAVFRGGLTLVAAETVASGEGLDPFEILDALTRLMDTSLLIPSGVIPGRYRMLETVRQYAMYRLVAAGEAERVRRRHANYFTERADEWSAALLGHDAGDWVLAFERDHDNFRAAIDWSLEANEHGLAVRLTGLVARYWWNSSLHVEARRRVRDVLAVAGDQPSHDLARVLGFASILASEAGDVASAQRFSDRELEMARAIGDRGTIVRGLATRASLAADMGDHQLAEDHLMEGLELLQKEEDPAVLLQVVNLGFVAINIGRFQLAERLAEVTLHVSEESNEAIGPPIVAGMKAAIGYYQGDVETAAELFEVAVAGLNELGLQSAKSQWNAVRSWVAWFQGDTTEALRFALRAREEGEDVGDKRGLAEAQILLARIAIEDGSLAGAAELLEQAGPFSVKTRSYQLIERAATARALLLEKQGDLAGAARMLGASSPFEAVGGGQPPLPHRDERNELIDSLKESLGDEEFEKEYASGAADSEQEAARLFVSSST